MLTAWLCASCGALTAPGPRPGRSADEAGLLAADLARTRPTGIGKAFRPGPARNPAVSSEAAVGPLRCLRGGGGARYGAHLELFADDRGVQVPAGIGISRARRRGVFAVGGHCRYQLSTWDPTGVIQVTRTGSRPMPDLGEFFDLWGEPLSRNRLASFSGPVTAFLDGRRWGGDPRRIPLRRHAQIELEVGPLIPPHLVYLFPRPL
jgi:hypothetical protein